MMHIWVRTADDGAPPALAASVVGPLQLGWTWGVVLGLAVCGGLTAVWRGRRGAR